MLPKNMRAVILILFLVGIIPLARVSADVGPKPSMEFSFNQEFAGPPVTIISGILFECEQPDCQDASPLQELGPQRFSCAATVCSALSYGFSPYHKLEIHFSDGITRTSNIFKTSQFQASYKVIVRQNDLLVTPRFSLNFFTPLTYVLICSGCLAGIVILVILIVLLLRRSARKK
jgi:hypothetical protein